MQADAGTEEAEVQCPQCACRFMVDMRPALLPRVKAQAVAPGPSAAERRKQAAEAARQSDRRKVMALVTAGPVLLGLLFWLGVILTRTEPPPELEPQWSSGKAAAVMEKARKQDQEMRLLQEAEEAKAMQLARAEAEAAAAVEARERARKRAALVTMVSAQLFDGETEPAEALVTEVEAVTQEVIETFNDGIAGNEPTTPAEMEQMIQKKLLPRIAGNAVILRGLKSRSPVQLAKDLMRRSGPSGAGRALPPLFQSGKYAGNGTGFWISGDGWLLTNQHVVGDFKSIDLRLADGKVVPASVEAVDRKNDLAVLKAGHRPSAWLPVSKGEKELGLGQMVFTIGYPNALIQGLEPKFTDGKISSQTGMGDDRNFYQTSIPVQPGNSGGPLVDFSTGWVVGVMSQRLDVGSDGRAVQSASYAVKCSLMTGFLASLAAVEQSRKEFPAPPLPKGDASGITDRVRNATVLVLTPR